MQLMKVFSLSVGCSNAYIRHSMSGTEEIGCTCLSRSIIWPSLFFKNLRVKGARTDIPDGGSQHFIFLSSATSLSLNCRLLKLP